MHLEDHAGDILAKAREACGLSIAQAAVAAGVSPEDWLGLESSGAFERGLDWVAIGELLKINGAKLEKITKGWLPKEPDLSQWRELRRFTTRAEGLEVHCYLVWDEVSREAAIFDTGWEAAPLLKEIQENSLTLRHIFLTHSHEDHLGGLADLRQAHPKALLHTGSKNAPPQHRNRNNDFIHLGNLRITNRETPGHTEDGVTYIVGSWPEDAPHVAMVGDALFAGSMGRGNFSADLGRQKVREQILTLPQETLIAPGHGPFTTVLEEREINPFF